MVVSAHEIREALDVQTVRGLQIMQVGLTGGVLAFAAVVYGKTVLLGAPVPEADASSVAWVRTLSLLNAAVTVVAWTAGAILFRHRSRVRAAPDSAAARVEAFRGAWILRWALIEGAALLGVAICYLAAGNGVLAARPGFWLNLLPAALMVAFAAASFPTQDRLAAALTDRTD